MKLFRLQAQTLHAFGRLCTSMSNLRTAWYEKVHFMIRIGDSLCLPSSQTQAILFGHILADKAFCKGQNRRAGDIEESQEGGDIVYF